MSDFVFLSSGLSARFFKLYYIRDHTESLEKPGKRFPSSRPTESEYMPDTCRPTHCTFLVDYIIIRCWSCIV